MPRILQCTILIPYNTKLCSLQQKLIMVIQFNSLSRCTISDIVFTHVLENDLAVAVLVSAAVLVGPFDGKD